MGGPTWKAIHEQLLSIVRPLRKGAKVEETVEAPAPVTEVDLVLEPDDHAEPQPPTVIGSLIDESPMPEPVPEPELLPELTPAPPPAVKAGKKSKAEAPAFPERSVDLSGPALKDMLDRLMYGLSPTAWAGWLDMRAHDFAARTDNAPEAQALKLVAETVTADLDLLAKRGQMREMISTFSEHHEIMVPHPLDSTLVLYLFARLDDLPLATLRRLILDDLMD